MGIELQHLFRYHEDPTFLEYQQARCCSLSFSIFEVHYLLNSSSTEEPLFPICIVRNSKVYPDPSRTKHRSCSQRILFCFMITHVHMFPGSHMGNRPSLSGSSLTIHPTAWTCHPVISMCLVP